MHWLLKCLETGICPTRELSDLDFARPSQPYLSIWRFDSTCKITVRTASMIWWCSGRKNRADRWAMNDLQSLRQIHPGDFESQPSDINKEEISRPRIFFSSLFLMKNLPHRAVWTASLVLRNLSFKAFSSSPHFWKDSTVVPCDSDRAMSFTLKKNSWKYQTIVFIIYSTHPK